MKPVHVDLWNWRLDAPDEAALWPLLSDDEKARADRYVFVKDRTGFIASRGRLREILSAHVDAPAAALVFGKREHGKPFVAGREDLLFNFSDTGAYGSLAVAEPGRAGPLGVDIETVRKREWLKLSQRYFSPAEHALMEALPDADQKLAFFRGWTRKEAFLKAVGTGLSTRLDAFDVTILADDSPRVTRIDPAYFPEETDVGAWSLAHFDPAPDVFGAIALRTGGGDIAITVRERV